MEISETNSSLGYGKPPWVFKGSALYQLHLVKAETARAFIPKELRLVEAFGYTLGGFFLANYEDSPAGIFDELVVIAGIVWNPPTSCAWAARVLVNSERACLHGLKDVGLPSRVASFSKITRAPPVTKRGRFGGFLNKIGLADPRENTRNCVDVQIKEINHHRAMDLCSINVGATAMGSRKGWMGPAVKMSLPSFSGCTEHNPHLLKYSCQIECRVRPVSPAIVNAPNEDGESTTTDHTRNLSLSVMLSKPILALEFNHLEMKVEDPTMVPQQKQG